MLSRVLVLLPLIVAFSVILRKVRKAYKATPYGPDEKEVVRDSWKGIAYICAAAAPAGFLPSLGVVGVTLGTLISVVLSILIVLCVVDLPDRLSGVHNLAWREWRKTPGYSKTDEPVEYVRWARRAAMLLFLLFVLVAAIVGGDSTSVQANSGTAIVVPTITSTASAVPSKTSAAPATSAAPQATASAASASSAATKYVESNCRPGPSQIPMVNRPSPIDFGTTNLRVCWNGGWKAWGDMTSNAPPKTVQLTAWVEEGVYGYGQVTDTQTDRSYVVRATDFEVSSS